MQDPPLFNSIHTYVQSLSHFFVNSHLEAELYHGSEFVVANNSQMEKLEQEVLHLTLCQLVATFVTC